MEESVYLQLYIFLFTLYGGLIIGILYDMIDILLHEQKSKSKGRGKTDILFWMLAIVIILGILFYSNDGVVRVYTLSGFAVGWLLYFWLLSKFIQKLIIFMLQMVTGVIRTIVTLLLIPYRWVKKLLYRPVMKVYQSGTIYKKKVKKVATIPHKIIEQFQRYKKYLGKKE